MAVTAILILIFFSFGDIGILESIIGSAWPAMYTWFGVSVSFQSIISVIIAVSNACACIYYGKIKKWLKTSALLIICEAATAFSLLGFALTHSYIFLCTLCIPFGFAIGFLVTCLNDAMARHYGARQMSWMHCLWGLGATVGPLFLSIFLNKDNWQGGFLCISALQLVLAVVLFLTRHLWIRAFGKEEDKTEETTKDSSEATVEKVGYGEALRQKGAWPTLTAFIIYSGIEQVLGLWGTSYLTLSIGATVDVAARIVSFNFLGVTIGRFLTGLFTSKLTNRQLINTGISFICLGAILAMVTTTFFLQAAAFFMIGMGCAPICPLMLLETPKRFQEKYVNIMMGLQTAVGYIGVATLAPLFGLFASNASGILPVYVLALTLILIVSRHMLYRKNRKASANL